MQAPYHFTAVSTVLHKTIAPAKHNNPAKPTNTFTTVRQLSTGNLHDYGNIVRQLSEAAIAYTNHPSDGRKSRTDGFATAVSTVLHKTIEPAKHNKLAKPTNTFTTVRQFSTGNLHDYGNIVRHQSEATIAYTNHPSDGRKSRADRFATHFPA